ncbi:radical SAM protein [Sporolactobacillus terrae]|uniref:radical SAM protein n=1 Tax=Sporolactobacillus terrae TaxID=269673 RepID=UPI0004921152|nr:radical SAM protein [Sporolactobacillus terrae]
MKNKFIDENDIWALSITITGKCNAFCDYCHFYARKDRKEYNINLDEEVFKKYVQLIKRIKEKYHKNLQVRFSGGEPLMARNRLFEYSEYIYQETGIKPFALSNGKALDEKIMKKADDSHLSGFYVSIENPFDPAPGAPLSRSIIQNIKDFNSEKVRVVPAIMIVKNDSFKHLTKIADYIYEETGTLPAISELTYQAFESPTDEQLQDLSKNVKDLCYKYYGVAPIRLFPYVSPEFFANGEKNFLSELDLENSLNVNEGNIDEIAERLYQKLGKSYVNNPCEDKDCPWYNDCRQVKWLWFHDSNTVTGENRIKDFCRMKKVLNEAIYVGITKKASELGYA